MESVGEMPKLRFPSSASLARDWCDATLHDCFNSASLWRSSSCCERQPVCPFSKAARRGRLALSVDCVQPRRFGSGGKHGKRGDDEQAAVAWVASRQAGRLDRVIGYPAGCCCWSSRSTSRVSLSKRRYEHDRFLFSLICTQSCGRVLGSARDGRIAIIMANGECALFLLRSRVLLLYVV